MTAGTNISISNNAGSISIATTSDANKVSKSFAAVSSVNPALFISGVSDRSGIYQGIYLFFLTKRLAMAHFMERLTSAFDREGVRYAIVGGFAVALHGAPRGTIDVDCIIRHTEADFEACERALRAIGLQPRLPVTAKEVFKFREEYIQRRNLIAWSFVNANNPVEVVDIIITHDLAAHKTIAKQS